MEMALVTGATGFIGSNLVAGLNGLGVPVRVLRRPSSRLEALVGLEYEPVVGDILMAPDQIAPLLDGCDWLFHVAAVSDYWRQGTDKLYQVNVGGTKNMLAAAALAGVKRFIFTSSLASLGVPERGQLLTERDQFNLKPEQFPYGHSKHLAEQEVLRAAEEGLPAVIVNPTVVLGPRDLNQISGALIVEAARGRLRFTPPGGVNFVAVTDVVKGHIAAAQNGRSGQRYILAGENLRFNEAIPLICEVVGARNPSLAIPRWALPVAVKGVALARFFLGNRVPLEAGQLWLSGQELFADDSKGRRELGIRPTPIVEAVKRAYMWYFENGYIDRKRN